MAQPDARSLATASAMFVMSAKLSKEIGLSALAPGLKFTAVMMTLHGDDDGNNIRPSVARVAQMTGKTERQVRRDISELCRLEVLTALTGRVGGARRATLYRLNVEALPQSGPVNTDIGDLVPHHDSDSNPDTDDRDSGDNPDMGDIVPAPCDPQNPDTGDRVPTSNPDMGDEKPGHGKPKTRTPMSADRIDRIDRSVLRTTAQTLRFKKQAKEPNGTNYKPIAKLVRLLLEGDPSLAETGRYGELVEAAKQRCADLRIDYGRHDAVPFDVVHRACASELMKAKLFGSKPASARKVAAVG